MSKKMLINATHPEENRVAIVVDGILTELDIEIAGKEQTKGNVYKATVVRAEPGLQAAFVDYGAERLGFLQMGEIHPQYFRGADESKGRPRINDVLRRGQELLVQVVKEERGTKGAALTTFLSLPGRYMVLMPESDTHGVSRKIEDEAQRKELKKAMASLDLPANMGYIVRTAGIGQTAEELKRDFDYLVRVWENIRALAARVKAPALLYKESNLVIRSIRDYFSSDIDEVLVDDQRVLEEARDFFQQVMPEYASLVRLHQERRPIFSRYQIEEQIETISKNKVPLPSGGSIVIDATEALVAIDVNSGKMAGEQGVESTAYKTNLEAAEEAARQLRLRDLGGLVVLDFIDMRDRKHIREVEKRLKDALKYDKARVTVGKISQFGLLEMSRQRIKAALAEGAYLPCPHCQGSGRIKSAEAQAIAFLRKVQSGIAKGQIGRVEGEIPLEVATYLLNNKREELLEMERRHNLSIFVKGRPDFIAGQTELTFQRREKEEELAELAELAGSLPAAPVPAEEAAEEGAKKKRKRQKKGAAEEAVPAVAVAAAQAEAAGAKEAAPEAGAVPAEEAGKKKRKRKRRKKKVEGEAAGPLEAMAAPEQPAEMEAAPEAGAAPAEEAGKKKRKRKRKKKRPEGEAAEAVAATPEGPTETTAEFEAAPAAEAEAEGGAKKKRKRRRKKKRAETEPAEAVTVEAAPAPQAEAPPPAAPAAAKPRRGRKKAEEPAAEAAPPVEIAPAEPKRRAPRKKAAEPEEAPAAKKRPARKKAAEPAEAPAADEAKPKRRAPRRKAAEAGEAE
jgi:ribonuclease E